MPCKEDPLNFIRTYIVDMNTNKLVDVVSVKPINKHKVPEIIDVKVINDKVVIVTFVDGTQTKAVCNKDDTFNLEVGIGICITKRLMSNDEKTGSSMFNKTIKNALKVMKRNEEAKKAIEKAELEKKKIEEKIKYKKQKRADKRREKRIQEMAAAILLANKTNE